MIKQLLELSRLPGVSSREDAVRDYICQAAAPYASTLRVDVLGNVIIEKKGTKGTGTSLLLAAHMDEVGLMIRSVTDEGYLKFLAVGGIDRRLLLGKKVLVGDALLPGIIGLKAYHLVGKEEEARIPKLSEFYIDIGVESAEAAKELVRPGDVAVFDTKPIRFGEGLLMGKALDDRIGCGVLLELLARPLPMDCTFVFTVQEEVGTRGAFGAAFAVQPEIALVIEGTTAADLPSLEPHQQVCSPGRGPVIPFMDGGTVYDRALFELLRSIAEEKGIPWQTKRLIAGGTDASAIQRTRSGVRVAGISAAVRYLHAPNSVASLEDYENMVALAYAFISAVAKNNEGDVCDELF